MGSKKYTDVERGTKINGSIISLDIEGRAFFQPRAICAITAPELRVAE